MRANLEKLAFEYGRSKWTSTEFVFKAYRSVRDLEVAIAVATLRQELSAPAFELLRGAAQDVCDSVPTDCVGIGVGNVTVEAPVHLVYVPMEFLKQVAS